MKPGQGSTLRTLFWMSSRCLKGEKEKRKKGGKKRP